MRSAKFLILLGVVIFLAGCVPSLHPLFTDKDLVFEQALVGSWVEEDGKSTWTFQKSGENAYELVYTENEKPARFQAHLLKLGNYLFLDVFPEESDMKNGLYKGLLIPAHGFAKIRIEKDSVRLDYLNPDWLKQMVDEKKIKIGHDFIGDSIILTAETKDLQKFAVEYADDNKAFSYTTDLHRQE
jgi:hypothetical protein